MRACIFVLFTCTCCIDGSRQEFCLTCGTQTQTPFRLFQFIPSACGRFSSNLDYVEELGLAVLGQGALLTASKLEHQQTNLKLGLPRQEILIFAALQLVSDFNVQKCKFLANCLTCYVPGKRKNSLCWRIIKLTTTHRSGNIFTEIILSKNLYFIPQSIMSLTLN